MNHYRYLASATHPTLADIVAASDLQSLRFIYPDQGEDLLFTSLGGPKLHDWYVNLLQ